MYTLSIARAVTREYFSVAVIVIFPRLSQQQQILFVWHESILPLIAMCNAERLREQRKFMCVYMCARVSQFCLALALFLICTFARLRLVNTKWSVEEKTVLEEKKKKKKERKKRQEIQSGKDADYT